MPLIGQVFQGGHISRSNYMEKFVFAPIDAFILLFQNMGKLEFPSPPRTDPQAFYRGSKNQ